MATFWKPGTVAPGSDVVVEDREEKDSGGIAIYNPNARLALDQQRRRLPIFQHRLQVLYLVEKFQTVIICGSTGSGKTTQVVQYLHEAGWTAGGRIVACTQPRRVAATSVAQRVADEMGVLLGTEVGYSVRFDDRWDPAATRIKFITDGMLVREMLLDPLLQRYSVIMLDEAHERSLYTDILIGLLKKVQKKRPDLRLVVSSATLDAETFFDFFNTNRSGDPAKDTAAVMTVDGRMFPVDIHYVERPISDYLSEAVETVVGIHTSQPPGDVLVFLTGQDEIDTAVALISDRILEVNRGRKGMNVLALPMYAGLPPDEQYRVFEPAQRNTRKVIVATNVAETSITIEGIVYVVDCGFVKKRTFNFRTGVESLVVCPTSRASAQQRAGRAGRVRAGKSYRLYTEAAFHDLLDSSDIPEMQRTSLETVVLQLKALGIDDVLHFDFLSPPPAESMARALEVLFALGAIDAHCRLTRGVGDRMAELPLPPVAAAMLLKSPQFHCSKEIVTIAAMLSVQGLFIMRRDFTAEAEAAKREFAVHEGDHLTLLNVYNAYTEQSGRRAGNLSRWCSDHFLNERSLVRAAFVRKQLLSYLKRYKLPIESSDGDITAIQKCVASGYFAHAARALPDGSYVPLRSFSLSGASDGGSTATTSGLYMHPSSVLFRSAPPCVVYHDVVYTSKHFMRDVTVIDPAWLPEIAPHFYELQESRARQTVGQ